MSTLAPRAQKRPTSDTLHGQTRVDDYAWLRDDNWQQVLRDPDVLDADIRAYLEAENAYADHWLQIIKHLKDQLFEEMRGRMKEDDATVPSPDGPWAYYSRFEDGGEYPLICRLPSEDAYETASEVGEVVLNGPALAEGEAFFDLGDVIHAPGHDLIAYTVDTAGSEIYTLRFSAIGTKDSPSEEIPGLSAGFVFDKTGHDVLYVALDDHHRPRWVKRHVLGTDPAEDPVVYEETDPGFFLRVEKTESQEWVIIHAGDHRTSEARLLPADDFGAEPVVVRAREVGVEYDVTHWRDGLVIRTNHDAAVDFKVLMAPIGPVDFLKARQLMAHQPGVLIDDIRATASRLAVLVRQDALPRLVLIDAQGEATAIEFSEPAYSLSLMSGPEFGSDVLRYTYSSPTTPRQVIDRDVVDGSEAVRKVQAVPSGHNPADYEARLMTVMARDGQLIPVTLMARAGVMKKGDAPTYLYGYGSYGISMPASFSISRLSLADRGLVVAVAHIRGGKEKGYGWYLDGKAENKVNTFTDFIDVAQDLVDTGLTRAGSIAIHGGSAGGLLIGAVVNMAPDLFAAAVADVPFVDVLNTMCDAELPLTPPEWPEWGNPLEDAQAYDLIRSYSPYDNVRATSYPAILVLAGLTDPRVTYWEPAKWVARMRDVGVGDRPLLLKTNMDAGHGGASGRFSRLKETALSYAFLCHILEGM